MLSPVFLATLSLCIIFTSLIFVYVDKYNRLSKQYNEFIPNIINTGTNLNCTRPNYDNILSIVQSINLTNVLNAKVIARTASAPLIITLSAANLIPLINAANAANLCGPPTLTIFNLSSQNITFSAGANAIIQTTASGTIPTGSFIIFDLIIESNQVRFLQRGSTAAITPGIQSTI